MSFHLLTPQPVSTLVNLNCFNFAAVTAFCINVYPADF